MKRLFAGVLFLSLVGIAGCQRPPTEQPWSVLLLTLDTTRADRLGCYGHEQAQTPNLDALAATGVVFDGASAQSPITAPSHASILTGTYPPYHGVRGNGHDALVESRQTLAETLRAAGYRTAAVVSAFVLDRRFGLAQGFERYEDDPREMLHHEHGSSSRTAAGATAAALRATADFLPTDPFLLWVHYFDPHAPYTAPEPFRSRFPATHGGLYDAEIAAMDHAIGELIRGLELRGLMRRTLVVVVGDHGEGFAGPHREMTHGLFLYEDTLRIPLILSAPGELPTGTRVSSLARQIDVMPTVLELLGLPRGDEMRGVGLVAAMRGDPAAVRPVESYGETYVPLDKYGWSPLFQLRDAEWKYIEAPRPELYRLVDDRDEARNVADAHPERVAALRGELREILAETPDGDGSGRSPLSSEEAQRLRALGYAASESPRIGIDDLRALRDPKDWIRLEASIEGARVAHFDGRTEESLEMIDRALAEDPDNVEALSLQGECLAVLGRFEEAETAFGRITELRPEFMIMWTRLGDVQLQHATRLDIDGQTAAARKKLDEAARTFELVAERDRRYETALIRLGKIHVMKWDPAAARNYYRQALARNDRSFEAQLGLGTAEFMARELEAAAQALERALEMAGGSRARQRQARSALAQVYLELHRPERARESVEWIATHFPDDPRLEMLRRGLAAAAPR